MEVQPYRRRERGCTLCGRWWDGSRPRDGARDVPDELCDRCSPRVVAILEQVEEGHFSAAF